MKATVETARTSRRSSLIVSRWMDEKVRDVDSVEVRQLLGHRRGTKYMNRVIRKHFFFHMQNQGRRSAVR